MEFLPFILTGIGLFGFAAITWQFRRGLDRAERTIAELQGTVAFLERRLDECFPELSSKWDEPSPKDII